jgi:hypothetical protein
MATDGGGFTLYSTTSLAAGSWTLAAAQTNGGQIIVTQTLDMTAKFSSSSGPEDSSNLLLTD